MITTTPSTSARRALAALAFISAGTLGLSACASSTPASTPTPATESATAAATSSGTATPTHADSDTDTTDTDTTDTDAAAGLAVADAWTRSTQDDATMTGSFGTLTNTTDADIRVTAVSAADFERVELHEMVPDASGTMVMRQLEDGFTVPAGESFELVPGGNHIMFMDLSEPLLAGEEVAYQLELEDGSTVDVTSPVRDFTMEDGDYDEGEHEDHGDH
ncbi:MAG: copper chaperone PCu(A)C [Micrococcus sp.]|nr:copper chaperone PCu(A)C [Micrococcus sp.]